MSIKVRKMELKDIEQVLELCDEIREYHRNILDGYTPITAFIIALQ